MQTDHTNINDIQISLIVPIKDESRSLEALILSIKHQKFQPAEIILVDGGSTDNTVELAEKLISGDDRYKLIKTPEASPGKGRNIGVQNARFDWIAFTDAGITLEPDWLEKLVDKYQSNPEIDMVYGNFDPHITSLFEKCAVFVYVAPKKVNGIRDKFIASSLMKKKVWETVGGFPDLRAAEDNIFMEAVEKYNHKISYAPEAMVRWRLSPDFWSTFQKFILYSKYNVWASRQWEWHYGIAKKYLVVLPLVILGLLHSWWWFLGVGLWIFVRAGKRILQHRYEFGLGVLFNPLIFVGVSALILVIDAATFIGWAKAAGKE